MAVETKFPRTLEIWWAYNDTMSVAAQVNTSGRCSVRMAKY